MAWGCFVNDVDLSTLGFYLEESPARLAAPVRSFSLLQIPGRMGGVIAADATTAPRTLVLQGTIDPPLRTVAQRAAFEDKIKSVVMRGLVRVVVDDDVTAPRAIDGVGLSVDLDPVAHPVTTQLSRARLTFLCPDPTWYDVSASVVAFGSTLTSIPIGTAPTGGLLRIAAPAWGVNCVQLVVTYASGAGLTIGTMVFDFTLVAGTDYVEIDLDRQTAVKVSSGVSSNALANLVSGDFFVLDPNDGDPSYGLYPQLSCTSTGAGKPSGLWLGLRRYL